MFFFQLPSHYFSAPKPRDFKLSNQEKDKIETAIQRAFWMNVYSSAIAAGSHNELAKMAANTALTDLISGKITPTLSDKELTDRFPPLVAADNKYLVRAELWAKVYAAASSSDNQFRSSSPKDEADRALSQFDALFSSSPELGPIGSTSH